jgi:hypothetical protein
MAPGNNADRIRRNPRRDGGADETLGTQTGCPKGDSQCESNGKRPDLPGWTSEAEKGRLRGRPGCPAPGGLSAKEIERRKAANR